MNSGATAKRQLDALCRNIDGIHVGARAGEFQRIRPDPAANLKNALPVPALELSESGDVRLDEIFSLAYFSGPRLAADGPITMSDIARATVPELLNFSYRAYWLAPRNCSSANL
jgi:hypothetical protein